MIKQCCWYSKYVHWLTLRPSYFTKSSAHVWNTLNFFFFLEFREYMSFAISSSINTWGIKLGIAEVLFVSVSTEKFSGGYSALGVLSFSIWLCDPWLLIEISLNLEKAESTKSLVQLDQLNQQVQSLFCSCWQHPRLLVLAVCFDTMLDNCYSQIYL